MTSKQIKVCQMCIEQNIPFALVSFIGESNYVFFSSTPAFYTGGPLGADSIAIRPFGVPDNKNGIVLSRKYSEDDVLSGHHPQSTISNHIPETSSLSRKDYIDAVENIIKELKKSKGKTVFSKTIAAVSDITPTKVATKLFATNPQSMRFIYYTPDTGLWLGATPEIIARKNTKCGTIESMALAGTRLVKMHSSDWDEKNAVEHLFVVRHIAETYERLGLNPVIGDVFSLRYGDIEHLAHVIFSGNDNFDIIELTNALVPTPAICGVPTEDALAHISQFEKSPRLCYGGEIIINANNHYESYLNIRSAHVCRCTAGNQWIYNIHVGGGIVATSDPDKEWEETENKAKTIVDALLGHSTHI